MKMIRTIGLLLLLMFLQPLHAQDIIKGHVVDEATGEGIGFASVQYKGLNLVAITDPQGYFTIRLLKGKRLTISVLGYKTHIIDVSDDSEKLSVNFDVTDKSNAVLSFYNFNSQLTIGNSEPLVLGTYHDKELSLLVRLSRLEKGGRTINYTWLLKELSND